MFRPSIRSLRVPCRRLLARRGALLCLLVAPGAALALAAAARPAAAGQGVWTAIGPYGGTVTALAVAPGSGTIYAGTASSGLFISPDGGATWRPVPKGPGGGEVMALALAPGQLSGQLSTIHVSVNGLPWRSDNGGASWTRTAFPNQTSSLAVAASDSRVVYASDGFSVFASGDGGASVHQAARVSSLFLSISALAVSPLSASEVVAVTSDGLFKTPDGGATWGQLPVGEIAVSLAIDPFDPATLYAGAGDGAFLTSHDRGATWARTGAGLGAGSLDVIAPDPATRGVLYAGVNGGMGGMGGTGGTAGGIWKSADGGATWALAVATAKVDAVAASAVAAGKVLAGLEPAGILKSEDQGVTWLPGNQGLSGTVVFAAAADPFTPGTFYAAVYSHNQHNFVVTGVDDQLLPLGLQRSRDGGVTWEQADAGLDTGFVNVLIADPGRPGRLYAGSNAATVRVFTTADGADSWQPVTGALGLYGLFDLALDPRRPGLLYLVGASQASGFLAERSTDGGASWRVLPLPGTNEDLLSVALDPFSPARVYLAGSVLLESNHRGNGLAQIGSGFPRGLIDTLLADPAVPRRLFAIVASSAHANSFFRSLDGGATWTRSSTGLPPPRVPLYALAADAATATVFISAATGVYFSHAGGAPWRPASNGLLGAAGGLLLDDPLHPGTVLTAPELGGLWTYTLAP
jgi:photosystem II stability/assembly factor-like uncharacterized protein